jgi:hypothetical protein
MNDRIKHTENALKATHTQRGSAKVPEGFSTRVMAAVRDEHRQSEVVEFPAGDGGLWMFARLAAAAAALALIFGYSQYAYGNLLPSIWASDIIGLTTMIPGF